MILSFLKQWIYYRNSTLLSPRNPLVWHFPQVIATVWFPSEAAEITHTGAPHWVLLSSMYWKVNITFNNNNNENNNDNIINKNEDNNNSSNSNNKNKNNNNNIHVLRHQKQVR